MNRPERSLNPRWGLRPWAAGASVGMALGLLTMLTLWITGLWPPSTALAIVGIPTVLGTLIGILCGRDDGWLQRGSAVVTIIGFPLALLGGWFAYDSLRTSLRTLEITEAQSRPRLTVSGRAFLDRALRKPSFEAVIVNHGPSPARDVSFHLIAIFRNEVTPRYLGSFPIREEIEPKRPYRLAGATVEQTIIEWLRRAVHLYDPVNHGPSKLVYYLEYKDAITGRVWGGVKENLQPYPHTPYGDIDLRIER